MWHSTFSSLLEKGLKYLVRLVEVVGYCPVCTARLKKYEAKGMDIGVYDYECGAVLEVTGQPLDEKRKWLVECPFKAEKKDATENK